MNSRVFYGHSLAGREATEWEPLERHLGEVADLAAEFALAFQAEDWGRLLGQWHDLGKYSEAFQSYLRDETHPRVDHSTAGAQHADQHVERFGRLLAYVLAGHHAGLADFDSLNGRLEKAVEPWRHNAVETCLSAPSLGLPPITRDPDNRRRYAFQCALFARMLFSCLIDADRLATERFCDQEKAEARPLPISIAHLAVPLNAYLARLSSQHATSQVNTQRQQVLEACRRAAKKSPGLFSLSVPTGGGKTLSSLAFAVDHAVEHGLRRVVVAIPFTSIIEQTAEQYRNVFKELGEDVLIEHHTGVDPDEVNRASLLATENWDAPLIVTTNVQLFESLFSARTTPCRKLHRLANSVIVLDEAQTLPVDLLRPCLAVLRELIADYGCSIVLCTATQPALERRDDFSIGLADAREIVSAPEKLYESMRRVKVTHLGPMDNDQLVERLHEEPAWLTIVNTRPHAKAIYARLKNHSAESQSREGLYHLSTLMCAKHRSDCITEIKLRLVAGKPCRVVSTQLVEAGVDISFPVVFRAMTGLDSIAQAAGRCNRHGELSQLGRVYLFEPAEIKPYGYLGAAAATAREVLPDYDDILSLSAVRRYFELHYWSQGVGQAAEMRWDEARVMECFPAVGKQFAFRFRTADERFQFIKEATQPVFVPYHEGERLIEQLRKIGPNRQLLRKLQRYAVGLHQNQLGTLLASHDVELLKSGYYALSNYDMYDKHVGVRVDRPGQYNPGTMVV